MPVSNRPDEIRDAELRAWRARQDQTIAPMRTQQEKRSVADALTHREYALARRTPAQREALLQEALDDLRAGTRRPAGVGFVAPVKDSSRAPRNHRK